MTSLDQPPAKVPQANRSVEGDNFIEKHDRNGDGYISSRDR